MPPPHIAHVVHNRPDAAVELGGTYLMGVEVSNDLKPELGITDETQISGITHARGSRRLRTKADEIEERTDSNRY